jgi:hypothetical protein
VAHLPAEQLAIGHGRLVRWREAARAAVAVTYAHARHDHGLHSSDKACPQCCSSA